MQEQLGRWGSHRGDAPPALGRNLSPSSAIPSVKQRKDGESSISCVLSACGACPGMIGCHSSSLSWAPWCSSTFFPPGALSQSREASWPRCMSQSCAHCCCTGIRAGYSLQLNTQVGACSQQSSVWAAALVVVGAEYPLNTCLQSSVTLNLNLICTIADSKVKYITKHHCWRCDAASQTWMWL